MVSRGTRRKDAEREEGQEEDERVDKVEGETGV
jgi:hypothetical protein